MSYDHPFVREVAGLSFAHCFNPYADRCPVHDRPDAPAVRSATLSQMVARAQMTGLDALWIGRDLGYRGGRRTGLALTDDVNVARHARRWNIAVERPTVGRPVEERTAAVIWSMLDRIDAPVFLWNVFPLHPHEQDNPFSNRPHNAAERRAGEAVLKALITLLRPRRIVAIGNDAAAAARKVAGALPFTQIRHPSYGGQQDFIRQLTALYALEDLPRLL